MREDLLLSETAERELALEDDVCIPANVLTSACSPARRALKGNVRRGSATLGLLLLTIRGRRLGDLCSEASTSEALTHSLDDLLAENESGLRGFHLRGPK